MSKINKQISLGYDASGNRIRKWIHANTKAEASRMEYELRKQFEYVSFDDIRFKEYSEKWIKKKEIREPATVESYKNTLKLLEGLNELKVRDITNSDLQTVIVDNKDHPRTCALIAIVMRQIFEDAVRDNIIKINQAEKLELPKYKSKAIRFLDEREIKIVSDLTLKDSQENLFMHLLLMTGLRPGEALALTWKDIDLKKSEIRVNKAVTFVDNLPQIKSTKTGVSRTVPISSTLKSILTHENGSNSAFYVFTRETCDLHTKNSYRTMSNHILKEINTALGGNEKLNVLNGLTMYSFRHTFATYFLYYNGVMRGLITTKKAAEIMGHSEAVFLKTYTHILDEKESIQELFRAM